MSTYSSPALVEEPKIDIPRGDALTLPLYIRSVEKFLTPAARCSEYFDLGLIAEGHELLDHARRSPLLPSLRNDIKKEVGDLLFFIVLQPVIGGTVIDRPPLVGNTQLNEWHEGLVKRKLKGHGYAEYDKALDTLEVQLGQYAGVCAKIVREPDVGSRKLARVGVLHNLLAALETVATYWGFSLRDAAEANLEKLTSRAARGKITGDGDHR